MYIVLIISLFNVCLLTCHFRAFISCLATGNSIRVFKLAKKEDGSSSTITASMDFPKVCHPTYDQHNGGIFLDLTNDPTPIVRLETMQWSRLTHNSRT